MQQGSVIKIAALMISVVVEYNRRPNTVSSGLQASQHRSQPSQQSFSQGLSSQHGVFSHFSQRSLDEAVTTNDQVKQPCLICFLNDVAVARISVSRIEECRFPIAQVYYRGKSFD